MTLEVLVSRLIHAAINIFEFNFIEGKLELGIHALFSISYSQCARQQPTDVVQFISSTVDTPFGPKRKKLRQGRILKEKNEK